LCALLWLIGLPVQLRAASEPPRYFRFLTESSGAQLAALAPILAARKINPVIDRVFPFEQSIDALEYAAQGRAKGKIVIQVKD
jgi:NADPH:quinone reductase-like Zn-dependent oxidoreductase